jgi:hypothetical protein
MGEVEERRPIRGAAVEHLECAREVHVEIDDGRREPIEHKHVVAGVPPPVRRTHGQPRLNARPDGCRAIVARLQAEGSLRPAIDPSVTADLLWTMTSLRTWEDLVLTRGWSA